MNELVAHPVAWSAARAMLVATLALLMSIPLRTVFGTLTGTRLRFACAFALAPLFVPDLLLGFTFRLTAARIVGFPAGTELIYGGLLLMRCVPIAAIVFLLLPHSTVTQESLFLWDSLGQQGNRSLRWRWNRLLLRVQGPWRAGIVAWCLMALLTFQEFEMSALMQIDRHPVTWTVWLFDAHASWQPLGDSLWMLLNPLMFESLLLLPVAVLIATSTQSAAPDAETQIPTSAKGWRRGAGLAVVGTAVISLILLPLILNSQLLRQSLRLAGNSPVLFRLTLEQVLVSLAFASVAAVMALILARWCLRRRWRCIILLPGLWGSLTCSLFLLALFQLPVFRPMYDSWLPLLLGLVLTHLPRAVILVIVLSRVRDVASIHAATLLRNSAEGGIRRNAAGLLWSVVDLPWILAGAVLTHWCFWDVTSVAILRPVDLEPIITRLYNEMHYGRTEALALSTALACMATPLAALSAAALWRLVRRRRGRIFS